MCTEAFSGIRYGGFAKLVSLKLFEKTLWSLDWLRNSSLVSADGDI